jgi:hypothetical protein
MKEDRSCCLEAEMLHYVSRLITNQELKKRTHAYHPPEDKLRFTILAGATLVRQLVIQRYGGPF